MHWVHLNPISVCQLRHCASLPEAAALVYKNNNHPWPLPQDPLNTHGERSISKEHVQALLDDASKEIYSGVATNLACSRIP